MEYSVEADQDELNLPWPGRTFASGSQFFLGLLGTAHGRGVAYLLTQHARGLPNKNIASVTVFTTANPDEEDEGELYHLLFVLTG